jgi:hypothetical protein
MGDFGAGFGSEAQERKFTEVNAEKDQYDLRVEIQQITQDSPKPAYGGVAPIFFQGQNQAKDGGRLPGSGQVVPPKVGPLDSGPPIKPPTGTPFNPGGNPGGNQPGGPFAPPLEPGKPGQPGQPLDPNAQWRKDREKEGMVFPQPGQVVPPGGLPGNTGAGGGPAEGYGPLGPLPVATDAQRKEVLDKLILRNNISLYMLEGALGGVIGSGPLPYLMDRATMTPFSLKKVGIGAGIGGLVGLGYGTFFDQENVARDTAWGAGIGGGFTALASAPGVSTWWKHAHSPLQMQIEAEAKKLSPFKAELTDASKDLGAAKEAAARLEKSLVAEAPALQKLITETEKAYDALGTEAKASSVGRLMERRLGTLMDARTNPLAVSPDVIKTSTTADRFAPYGEGKFLSPQEAELLMKRHTDQLAKLKHEATVASATERIAGAKVQAEVIEANMANLKKGIGSEFNFLGTAKNSAWKTMVKEDADALSRWKGNWRGNEWRHKLGEGVFIASLGLATNYALDLALTKNDQKLKEDPRFYFEGPAVAAALCLGNKASMWTRGSLVVGSVLAERFVAPSFMKSMGVNPNEVGQYSAVFQPNWIDAVGMSAAWMMPFRSEGWRFGAVIGAWALGRVASYVTVNDILPVPGIMKPTHFKEKNEALVNYINGARDKYDDATFQKIATAGTEMGMESDSSLVIAYTDFMNMHKTDSDPMYRCHTGAALETALGNFWLARGTLYDPTAHQDRGRLLAGKNVDLGGQAANFFFAADFHLHHAQEHLRKNNLGANPDLQKSRDYVQQQLKLIYGEHDIPAIITEIKKDYGTHIDLNGKKSGASDGVAKVAQDIAAQTRALCAKIPMANLETVSPDDKRFAAKMCRDTLILDLALAQFKIEKGDGSGGSIHFTQACKFLRVAELLDPNNKDVKQLRAELERTGPKVAQAIGKQWTNNINNPFGVSQ